VFLKPLPYSSSISNWMQSAFGGSPLIVRCVPGARPGFQRFSLWSDFPASGDGLAAIHLTIVRFLEIVLRELIMNIQLSIIKARSQPCWPSCDGPHDGHATKT
jgi:hypothetical protein